MQLSKNTINNFKPKIALQTPDPYSYQLPEKIIQFGTGVLLRGLPDYFVDIANKQGIFNGRIVMIKSTDRGNINNLIKQDNLYTICIRGLQNGEIIKEYYLNNSVSRILIANDQWKEVLECASDENMEVVISNTTEVGIQLTDDDICANPPSSFPGKLLAFVYARYNAFKGDANKGLVIIPTELIVDNGTKLREILVQLSRRNKLSEEFIRWLLESNTFCNSLVDRIVPGKPEEPEKKQIEDQLGYEDAYLIEAEPYRLWAIEVPDESAKNILSFSVVDNGIVLTKDISKYRQLKLRLLNATHTFSCALAYLSGLETVKSAMENNKMHDFIQSLMVEIENAIVDESISPEEAKAFASQVSDRFRNPYIVHNWLSISAQYSSKIKMRNVPLLIDYYDKFNKTPQAMAKGFAAYILFMRSGKLSDGTFQGELNGKSYIIQDDRAETLHAWWKQYPNNPVKGILSDTTLWGMDLTQLAGLTEEVESCLHGIMCS